MSGENMGCRDPKNGPAVDPREAQVRMLAAIREIKSNPERFARLRDELKGKTSDDERAAVLVDFITRHDDLMRGLPSGDPAVAATITTVTVTTIFIFTPSAY